MKEELDKKENVSDELIRTFYEIDEKIQKLHAHSSEVFMQLNSYLKDYHKKSRIVSENATNIFTTMVGNEKANMINDLEALMKQLANFRENTKKNSTEIYGNIDELIEKINMAVVQARNFKQDLLTLDYLIANYRFVKNYNQRDKASE